MRFPRFRRPSQAMHLYLARRRIVLARLQAECASEHNYPFPRLSLQVILAYLVLRWPRQARPDYRESMPKIARIVLAVPRAVEAKDIFEGARVGIQGAFDGEDGS